jgi:hypothetical protein
LCGLAGEAILSLIHMYEANYPEILKACYIINGNYFIVPINKDGEQSNVKLVFQSEIIKIPFKLIKYGALQFKLG